MSTTRLPELPAPDGFAMGYGADVFSRPRMHAYGLAVWKAALEAASEACERLADSARRSNPSYCHDGDEYAAVIQHLPLPEQGGPQ